MIKTKDVSAIKNGEMTVEKLISSYPITELVSDLMELVAQKENVVKEKPIVLSDEDYARVMGMFRQRGIAADGGTIRRGRPKKNEGVKTDVVEP